MSQTIDKNRFYFPDSFFRLHNKGSILAFFSFVDKEIGLEFSSFRLVNGQYGIFASSPSEGFEDKQTKEMKYYNHVRPAYDKQQEDSKSPLGKAYMDALAEAANEYYQKKQGGAPVGASAPSSGRGPVTDDETTDDLPF